MIKKLKYKDLTDIEKLRFRAFQKTHKNANCYYTTKFSLGAGYDIIATTLVINSEMDLLKVDLVNSQFITDEVAELENL